MIVAYGHDDMENIKLIGVDDKNVLRISRFLNNVIKSEVVDLSAHPKVLRRCGNDNQFRGTTFLNQLFVWLVYFKVVFTERPTHSALCARLRYCYNELRSAIKRMSTPRTKAHLYFLDNEAPLVLDLDLLHRIEDNARIVGLDEAKIVDSSGGSYNFILLPDDQVKRVQKNLEKAERNMITYKILSIGDRCVKYSEILSFINRLIYLCQLGQTVILAWRKLEAATLKRINTTRLELLKAIERQTGFQLSYLASILENNVDVNTAEGFLTRLADDMCVFGGYLEGLEFSDDQSGELEYDSQLECLVEAYDNLTLGELLEQVSVDSVKDLKHMPESLLRLYLSEEPTYERTVKRYRDTPDYSFLERYGDTVDSNRYVIDNLFDPTEDEYWTSFLKTSGDKDGDRGGDKSHNWQLTYPSDGEEKGKVDVNGEDGNRNADVEWNGGDARNSEGSANGEGGEKVGRKLTTGIGADADKWVSKDQKSVQDASDRRDGLEHGERYRGRVIAKVGSGARRRKGSLGRQSIRKGWKTQAVRDVPYEGPLSQARRRRREWWSDAGASTDDDDDPRSDSAGEAGNAKQDGSKKPPVAKLLFEPPNFKYPSPIADRELLPQPPHRETGINDNAAATAALLTGGVQPGSTAEAGTNVVLPKDVSAIVNRVQSENA